MVVASASFHRCCRGPILPLFFFFHRPSFCRALLQDRDILHLDSWRRKWRRYSFFFSLPLSSLLSLFVYFDFVGKIMPILWIIVLFELFIIGGMIANCDAFYKMVFKCWEWWYNIFSFVFFFYSFLIIGFLTVSWF